MIGKYCELGTYRPYFLLANLILSEPPKNGYLDPNQNQKHVKFGKTILSLIKLPFPFFAEIGTVRYLTYEREFIKVNFFIPDPYEIDLDPKRLCLIFISKNSVFLPAHMWKSAL